jgi:hypothetical protein
MLTYSFFFVVFLDDLSDDDSLGELPANKLHRSNR